MSILFEAIRHELLSLAHRPCNPAPDYSFAQCVQTRIMERAGCVPHWTRSTIYTLSTHYLHTIYTLSITIQTLSIHSRFPRAGLPVCGNWSMLALYSRAVHAVARLDRLQLTRDTGCVMPCSFMEYKVTPSHQYCAVLFSSCILTIPHKPKLNVPDDRGSHCPPL